MEKIKNNNLIEFINRRMKLGKHQSQAKVQTEKSQSVMKNNTTPENLQIELENIKKQFMQVQN